MFLWRKDGARLMPDKEEIVLAFLLPSLSQSSLLAAKLQRKIEKRRNMADNTCLGLLVILAVFSLFSYRFLNFLLLLQQTSGALPMSAFSAAVCLRRVSEVSVAFNGRSLFW